MRLHVYVVFPTTQNLQQYYVATNLCCWREGGCLSRNMHDCAGEKSAGNGSMRFVERFWKYIASLFSLSKWRESHFLTFCLTSLAFRPIPTCFRSLIQSHIAFIPTLSFSLDALSPATLSLHSTQPFNYIEAYSNSHVNLIEDRTEYKLLLRAGEETFSLLC